jgi:hypothetical protein
VAIAIEGTGTVASAHGDWQVSGIIDVLLETPTGYVILDDKTFPAPAVSAWTKKCAAFIPDLSAYALLLEGSDGKRVERCWMHLPAGGGIVGLTVDEPKGPTPDAVPSAAGALG